MGLSRLENFLKSVRGNVIYVDPNSLDSTDSVENQGNSLVRPFKTIQRALVEASRFSYQSGIGNDRFNKTTIVLYPGEHTVDNRPGYIPTNSTFRNRAGAVSLTDITSWDLSTNFDLTSPNNDLYKLNSVRGGVIVPRGTSIVGMDLRKTIIRPKYVPNPENDNIETSAIFRITGGCYFWQFTILDADPSGTCYKDYTTNTFVPNFSHHKLTGFEYVDGVNGVEIDDDFISSYKVDRTDLDMYYEKISVVYGSSTGRQINPTYPSTIDIEAVVDEYRIVGSTGVEVGITSIRSGDGVTSTNTITVTFDTPLSNLSVDTPIQIQSVGIDGYDGQYIVSGVNSSTEVTYEVGSAPVDPLAAPSEIANATLSIVPDSVTSSSPYISNVTLRSVYGMCGLLADGDKSAGFKSMLVSQFTGISLQKDDNAFLKYNSTSGSYEDNTAVSNLNSDSLARYKPAYRNYHIKAQNDAVLQLVSIFAIGYAEQFVTDSGSELTISNSNSNFGAKAFVSSGFKRDAFTRDDAGYITHIIPPQEIITKDKSIEFIAIDVGVSTSAGAGTTDRMYLYNETNLDKPPSSIIQGYRFGAKENDILYVELTQSGVTTEYQSRITMPGTSISFKKQYSVGRSSGINSITSNVLTLTENHSLSGGESIRIFSEDGHLPDGLSENKIYYAITDLEDVSLSSDQIKISSTFSDAINNNPLTINNKGGILSIESRVSDKSPNDLGHPIQWDTGNGQWYVNVASASTENTTYSTILSGGTSTFGDATPRTYVKRKADDRNLLDTIYRIRYVIPKENANAKPPSDGYIIQESNNVITSNTEIEKYFDPDNTSTLSDSTELRNPRFISTCSWSSNTATVVTELPHGLRVGSEVKIVNVTSTNNPTGVGVSGFNGTHTVAGISSSKQFTYSLATDPGTFTNNTSSRTTSLPYFQKKKSVGTYQIYKSQEIQKYISGEQDGIYHLIVVNTSNSPTVDPFDTQRYSQPIKNLYPQKNRDNPNSDPKASVTFAVSDPIGYTIIDNHKNSLTKETLGSAIGDLNVGFGLTNIVSNSAGTAHTFYTQYDHGFAGITSVSITSGGSGYSPDGNEYGVKLVGFAGSTTGDHATAVITISSGAITAVKIMDGGSAYGIGNTLTVDFGSPSTKAVLQVSHISNPVDQILQVEGVVPNSNNGYNTLYKITGVDVGNTKRIEVSSSESVSGASTTGVGITNTSYTKVINPGVVLGISTITYDAVTGLATIGFTTSHGLRVDNKVKISGASDSFFNKNVIVTKVNSNVSLIVDVGVGTGVTTTGGTIDIYRYGFASQSGDVSSNYIFENIGGRFNYSYAGITTTLSTQYNTNTDESTTDLDIPNAATLGIKLGDYLLIDTEIFRVKSDVTSNDVSVFRAQLGTKRETHDVGTVVRRIRVIPIELRRNSIIRASGHTFENVGFGPGNYSTALPNRQDRTISPAEELVAQNTKLDGGINIFTAMNSDGDFYTGNKKIKSSTGEEELYSAPIPDVTGEEKLSGTDSGFDVISPLEVSISRSLKVEGGDDNNLISQFDGPVIFNKKITSNSVIETDSLFLQGDETVSRKFSISDSIPTLSGNYGDTNFNSSPSNGDVVGWIYSRENEWKPFGRVGGAGVGISSNGTYVGFSTLLNIVALGITFTADHDSSSGISTLTWNANPRVAITTGALAQNLAGIVTTINFVGSGVTVTADTSVGIATIDISGLVGSGGSTPGLPYNSLQWNNNGSFDGVTNSYYDDDNTKLHLGNYPTQSQTLTITNDGRVGMSSTSPTSKLEIVVDNERALYVKSTTGYEIVRIENTSDDTTPFIIDQNGKVGINTDANIADLDVVGNVAVTGEVRIYETDRTNYVGLKAGSIGSDLTFTLPVGLGTNGYSLKTDGTGVLSWGYVSSEVTAAGHGISISKAASGGITTATISNTGITSVTAGTGITVTYTETSTGKSVEVATTLSGGSNLYPFTTRGFGMVL